MFATLAGSIALTSAVARYFQARRDLDAWIVVVAVTLALVGLAGIGLALAGVFGGVALGGSTFIAAIAMWRCQARHPIAPASTNTPRPSARWIWLVLIVGMGLRSPPMSAELAGQDQATYVLRARQLLRTATFVEIDSVLARAGRRHLDDPGATDLLGLYPSNDIEALRSHYEAAYRPGAYLTDRDEGRVVPQFLHLQPALLATAGLVFGPERVHWLSWLTSALALLGVSACARRLFGPSPWAAAAPLAFAVMPAAIWVHRIPLTETLFGAWIWIAALAVLRARDDADPRWLVAAGLLLGATTWLRGDAWGLVPVLALGLVARPRPSSCTDGFVAIALMVGLATISVIVHALTSFPYVFDEIRRQINVVVTPGEVIAATGVAVATWLALEWLGSRRHRLPTRPMTNRAGSTTTVVATRLLLVAAALPFAIRLGLDTIGDITPPYSRLSPARVLFDAPVWIVAAIGLVTLVRPRANAGQQLDPWAVALLTIPAVLALSYLPRNLPHAGMFYYARYLIPVLVPAVLLLATVGLRASFDVIERRRPRPLPSWATWIGSLSLAVMIGYPLVLTPTVRLTEYAGMREAVSFVAERIEPNAVVVAGGEGWMADHAFNQIGGALAMGHGITVLPYHHRESAFASLLALARDEAETGRPVYLLLNEQVRAHALDDTHQRAVLDDRLPPPLRAASIDLFEIVTHRSSPVVLETPIRITRLELRMALVRIELEPVRRSSATVQVDGTVTPNARPVCLDPSEPVIMRWSASAEPRSLVVTATSDTAATNHNWSITVLPAQRRVHTDPPRATPLPRSTLGPWLLASDDTSVAIVGARDRVPGAKCPHGGIERAELIGRSRSMVDTASTIASFRLIPRDDLGHAYTDTTWSRGITVSAWRPSTTPSTGRARVTLDGQAIVLVPSTGVTFAPVELPRAAPDGLELMITVMHAKLDPTARVVVYADDTIVAEFDPPNAVAQTWQSPPVRWIGTSDIAGFEIELRSPDPSDRIAVRDLAVLGSALVMGGALDVDTVTVDLD